MMEEQSTAPRQKGPSDRLAMLAITVLIAACLFAGTMQYRKISKLVESGSRAGATVVALERGTKGGQWPVYEFTDSSGERVRARDVMQRMFAPIEHRATMPVIYDPKDTAIVTADLGAWRWRGPAIFYGGAVLLAGFGLVIRAAARKQAKADD